MRSVYVEIWQSGTFSYENPQGTVVYGTYVPAIQMKEELS